MALVRTENSFAVARDKEQSVELFSLRSGGRLFANSVEKLDG